MDTFFDIEQSRCTRSVTLLHILNFSVIRIIRVRVSLSHSTSFAIFSPLQPSFKAGGIVALMCPQTGLKGDTDITKIDFVKIKITFRKWNFSFYLDPRRCESTVKSFLISVGLDLSLPLHLSLVFSLTPFTLASLQ